MSAVIENDDRVRHGVDVDLFSERSLLDPYADYEQLREAGPIAWMKPHKVWVATRYEAVKRVLMEPDNFSSAQGIGFNDMVNEAWKGLLPTLDRPDHTVQRKVYDEVLRPQVIAKYQDLINARAERSVDTLLDAREFDGAHFAERFPVSIMADLVGFPDDARRDHLVSWATDSYNCCGPMGSFDASFSNMQQLYAYVTEIANRQTIPDGTFAAHALGAVERGEVSHQQCLGIIGGYATASLDTTANAVSLLLMLFAKHPDQWAQVRDNPEIAQNAIREALRYETPAQWFTRVTTRDVVFDDIEIAAGTRMIHSYGAANRDPRKWPDPARFDVQRNTSGTLTWGFGIHACPGQFISIMEQRGLLTAMARRIDRIELTGEPVHRINNLTRGLKLLPLRIHPR
ncbi:cytochrome P450 [Nevskia ramosa]|uniref:cytochrome P450 n=1 Tax=Nevskia ramosa TaxID=64002 RepID=UPI003D0EA615